MKVYVLTEIDIAHVGYSPNTIQLFPTHDAAAAEMARMYTEALKRFNTTEDDPMNVFDAGGYALIGNTSYRLNIYECVLDLPRKEVVLDDAAEEMIQFYLDDTEFKHGDWPCSKVVEMREKFKAWLKNLREPDTQKVELATDAVETGEIVLYDEAIFGDQKEHFVRVTTQDGEARGAGIFITYPKLADLTPEQIRDINAMTGGRVFDSGRITPWDVCLYLGEIDKSLFGVVDELTFDPDLALAFNVAWAERHERFKPIICALYERDIDEITDSDCFLFDQWKKWPEYETGCVSKDWTAYNKRALEDLKASWDFHAENYLKHIADGKDLQCILDFVRG